MPHSYDFMAYAHLQLGQDAKAKALIDEAASIDKVIGPRVGGATGRAAVPARYMLERQDWQGAAKLKPIGTGVEAAEAVTHFARAMGGARSGDLAAADLEDSSAKHVAMENRLYPMRELLGDLLMQYDQPSWALKQYEASMLNAPNRLRGYYGAARAADASGERTKAAGYFGKLAQLTRTADSDRAEIRESRQRLASR